MISRVKIFLFRVDLKIALIFFGAITLTSQVFAAAPVGTGANDMDIAVIDRALATAQPGDTTVKFGDCGMRISDLQTFRARLVVEESPTQEEGLTPLVVTPNTTFKWPGGVVYYQFDPTQVYNSMSNPTGPITSAKEQQLRDAVGEWAGAANLQFVEVTGTPPANYVTVQEATNMTEGGYSSSVGMEGGQQIIQIGPHSWNRGTLCHEMGHALGLYHEQQRDDRDTYVTIDWSNISTANQPNFTKLPGGSTPIGPYDFYSVMEYSRNALSAATPVRDTITLNPGYTQYANVIGVVYDRTLSKLDRAGMAAIYGNPSVLPSALVTNTKDSGSGSLRSAIYYAFDRSTDTPPTTTAISFQIPKTDANYNSGTGVFTIMPSFQLPSPGDGTTIDGTTEVTFVGTTNTKGPEIVINGATSSQYENIGAGFQPALILRQSNCTVKGFVINGFDVQGIQITSNTALGSVATGNVVSGCYIGTDPTGSTSVPNATVGIEIFGGAYNNTIGGTTTAARNVISGNTKDGVFVHDVGTTNNLIAGNYIGLNALGTGSLGNGFEGVQIQGGAQANTIGGTTTTARNYISGNIAQGIDINDSGTTGNLVLGNYIGLNASGAVVGNGSGILATNSFFPGVEIFGGAQNNIVGGTATGSGNIISGNIGGGIAISDASTNGNLVEGNMIGLNASGAVAGNGSGNAMDHFYSGVAIFNGSQNNIVGGTATGAGNVISGNIGGGVTINGTGTNGNLVQGNLVGTNSGGSAAISNGNANAKNQFAGVGVTAGAQSNVIGGTTSAAKNLISGNAAQGVYLGDFGTNLNLVEGNYIGTNLAGTGAIANNQGVGIYNSAASNTIGGTIAGAQNLISGNTGDGIAMGTIASGQSIGPAQNIIAGNFVGVSATGTGALANGGDGVDIFNSAQSNTIGGSAVGARNIISGNISAGIVISQSGTNSNVVQGNWVGLNAASAALGNGLQGVSIFGASQSNVIGGTAAGAGNLISSNKDVGVGLYNYDTPNDTIKNSLSENSIFGNTNGGITLYNGANNTQPSPVLSSAIAGTSSNPNGTTISGTLTSAASTPYRIEFFASPSGGSQGQTFVGSANVTTNSSTTVSFTTSLTGAGVLSGNVITATATDPNGNTSPFSSAVTVTVGTSGLRAQTITFPAIANQPFNAGPITLNATSTSGLAITYSVTTGSGLASVSGSVVTITGAGAITIRASQVGNSIYSAATSVSQSFTATLAPQTITFPTIASGTFGSSFTLGATASSGLAVSYSVASGPATVSGSSLMITGTGTVTVQASQAGNTSYAAATSISQSFTVRQAPQTITFPAIANQASGGPPIPLNASASSGLAIIYSVVSGPATVSGNTLTTTGTGAVTVQANQSGNTNFFPALAVNQTFTVSSGGTTSSLTTDTPTMPPWGMAALMILLLLAASSNSYTRAFNRSDFR